MNKKTGAALCGALFMGLFSSSAFAENPTLAYSITTGATSDYVFRGFSNSAERPAAQGSVDITYGMFYAGIWGSSSVDYAGAGSAEVDFYAGIMPTWHGVTFDFAVLYYDIPTQGNGPDADYLELKAGASITPAKGLTLSLTNYFAPDGQFEVGNVYTGELTAKYEFQKIGIFTPSISGTLAYQKGFDDEYVSFGSAFGESDYTYWNAGLALAVEKLTFDFRYWDTNLDDTSCQSSRQLSCDASFVFSLKVTVP